ncbi:MAG: NADPH-dependent F420 reductase [Planctomycetes bacterium]|nr:NADPH-dependent F420 reductase [Planctomycetota bacterium]
MKIAILGTGNVGGALASVWTRKGHEIVFGTREPASVKVQDLVATLGKRAKAATLARACADAEIVVLATPWPAARETLESCGKLAGKLVIDCTNPLAPDLSGLSVSGGTSGGEQVAQWCGAPVFKAFNTTGAENMARATEFDVKPVMFYCGNDEAWRETVATLVEDAGFEAVDAGHLSSSRWLEPLAMLWIHSAYKAGLGTDWAFARVKRGK